MALLAGAFVPASAAINVPLEEARADASNSIARIAELEAALLADRASVQIKRSLASEYRALADALHRLRRDNEGVQELQKSLHLARELVEADATDVESRLILIESLFLRTWIEVLNRPVSERWVDYARDTRKEILALRTQAKANTELRSKLREKLRYLVNLPCHEVTDSCLMHGMETLDVIAGFADDAPDDDATQSHYTDTLQWFGMLQSIPAFGIDESHREKGIALLQRSLESAARITDADLHVHALVNAHLFLVWALAGTARDHQARQHFGEVVSLLAIEENEGRLNERLRSCLESLRNPKEDVADTISPCFWLDLNPSEGR